MTDARKHLTGAAAGPGGALPRRAPPVSAQPARVQCHCSQGVLLLLQLQLQLRHYRGAATVNRAVGGAGGDSGRRAPLREGTTWQTRHRRAKLQSGAPIFPNSRPHIGFPGEIAMLSAG